MILSISAIENTSTQAAIASGLDDLSWRDGKATAGAIAASVKQNEQAVMSDAAGIAMRELIMPLIEGNTVLLAAARPRRFSPLLVSRTGPGGHYGAHVDNALMGKAGKRIRSDLAFTLFLSPRESYDGGELIIHNAGVSQEIGGQAGQMVLYPASSIHEVRPVTRGQRIVCVGWIESLVPDSNQRELLFDLENLRVSLRSRHEVHRDELLTLDKSIANLLRMWAQP